MDVSNREGPDGSQLIDVLVSLTGIPAPLMQQELEKILQFTGREAENLTLDELRSALASYLENVQNDLFTEESCRVLAEGAEEHS
jgi:hypothetical protein